MGYTQAIGFAGAVAEGLTSMTAALNYHLFTNHFLPLPAGSLAVSLKAVRLAAQGRWEQQLDVSLVFPHAVKGNVHPYQAVYNIVKQWHLEPFVEAAQQLLNEEE